MVHRPAITLSSRADPPLPPFGLEFVLVFQFLPIVGWQLPFCAAALSYRAENDGHGCKEERGRVGTKRGNLQPTDEKRENDGSTSG